MLAALGLAFSSLWAGELETDPEGDPRLSSHGALLEERGAHHPSFLEVQHWRCEGHGVDG